MTRARVSVLSRDEIDSIHGATVDLLGEVGTLVREPRARRLLTDAGATAAQNSDCVRIPESLLQEAVKASPKRWTWHARDSRRSVRVGEDGRTRLGPGSACSHFVDFETGAVRAPTSKDGDRMVRLMDALEYVDINYSPVAIRNEAESLHYQEVARLVRDIRNTSKPVMGPCYDGAMARDGLEIAAILAGGEEELRKRPTVAGYYDPVGPLVHDRHMVESLLEYAARGQPVFITCADLAGASAPATLAGTLVQQNAEILSGVLIAHLVNPAAPVIYGSVSGAMDMRAGNAAFGGPELGLLSVASVQLAHAYGLPCSTGGQSDSKIHDAQAALEKATTLLASVLAGADFVDLFFGSYEGFNATSLEQVVIDHDIAGFAFRYGAGIEVNEETMALDVLREVGAGGTFLAGKAALRHTMRWVRTEHAMPGVLDRRSRQGWNAAGSKPLLEAAHEVAVRILDGHEPTPVDPAVWEGMTSVLERISKERIAGPEGAS